MYSESSGNQDKRASAYCLGKETYLRVNELNTRERSY